MSLDFFVFLILILVLILFLVWKTQRQVRKTHKIGNAQILGQREQQNDYFASFVAPNGLLAVVADGQGAHQNGRQSAIMAVDTCKTRFIQAVAIEDKDTFLQKTFQACHKNIIDSTYDAGRAGAALVMAVIQGTWLHWASVGSCKIFLYRQKELIDLALTVSGKNGQAQIANEQKLGQDIFPAQFISQGQIDLKAKDQILLCSDGIYQSISEIELISFLAKRNNPYDKAQNITNWIGRHERDCQDNATIVLIEA